MTCVPRNKLGEILMLDQISEDFMLIEKLFRMVVVKLYFYTKAYTKCLQSPPLE